jgi:glycosyltransferase involved in cell wall biosynthesis
MEKETVVCLAPRRWNSLWRETQQLMLRIAQQNRVIYVEPGSEENASVLYDFFSSSLNLLKPKVETLTENLAIVSGAPVIPIGRRQIPQPILKHSALASVRLNSLLTSFNLRRLKAQFNLRNPILWLSSPYDASLLGIVGEKLSVYFNFEEISEMINNRRIRNLIWREEEKLCRRVDVVFATSQAQWEKRKSLNENCYFVPNGVDFDLFSQALEFENQPPPDMADLPAEVIGFAGWLGYHIDIELLNKIALAFPGQAIVFVGPNELPDGPDRHHLERQQNVHFLGLKDKSELPQYIGNFRCALMPWAIEGHISFAYPLKLHEYLAAGRAAVATNLPELAPYRDVIRIARNHDEFIQHVRAAIQDYGKDAVTHRQAVAKENTWDKRVETIYATLDPMIAERI